MKSSKSTALWTTAAAVALGVSLATLSYAPAKAAEARVFSEIDVEGNSRFSDRDILATANLRPGEFYDERDLRAAIEDLEFTGEFDLVRIRSDGSRLVIIVDETPEFQGLLTFGLGYESDTGAFGGAVLSIENALGIGAEIYGEASVAQEVQTARLSIFDRDLISESSGAGIRLSYGNFEYDNTLFDYETASITPFVRFDLHAGGTLEARLSFAQTDINNVNATASAILQADAGEEDATTLGLTYQWGETDRNLDRLTWGALLAVDVGVGGDRQLTRTEARLNGFAPLPAGFALRSALELGHVTGMGSDTTRATDRFVLGGASLRGFERGTVSVRDINGGVITDLGGTSYAALRTELLLPLLPDTPDVDIFAFGDVGSVWGLDSPVAPSGVLRDDADIRTSLGIGASYDFAFGRLEGYIAAPISKETGDQEQIFGLTFRAQF